MDQDNEVGYVKVSEEGKDDIYQCTVCEKVNKTSASAKRHVVAKHKADTEPNEATDNNGDDEVTAGFTDLDESNLSTQMEVEKTLSADEILLLYEKNSSEESTEVDELVGDPQDRPSEMTFPTDDSFANLVSNSEINENSEDTNTELEN